MHHNSGLVFLLTYVAIMVALGWFGWAALRRGLTRRAQTVAAELERLGAHIGEVRPAAHFWSTAEVDFEHDGRQGKVTVRFYGRSTQLIGVSVSEPAMPAISLRREGAFTRVAMAMRLDRDVKVGDAAFDADVFVSSHAPEPTVREILGSNEVRRIAREIIDDNTGRWPYAVFLSEEGVHAMTFAWGSLYWRGPTFDVGRLFAMFKRVAALAAALPTLNPVTDGGPFRARPGRVNATPGKLRLYRFPQAGFVIPVFAAALVWIPLFASGVIQHVHTPINDHQFQLELALSLVLWAPCIPLFVRLYRGRPLAVLYVLYSAFAAITVIPFLGAFTLSALNAGLDHSPATTHHVRVVKFYRRNTHTVFVSPWDTPDGRQKIIVPPSIAVVNKGDALDVDTHPGAFGWTWVSGVRAAAGTAE